VKPREEYLKYIVTEQCEQLAQHHSTHQQLSEDWTIGANSSTTVHSIFKKFPQVKGLRLGDKENNKKIIAIARCHAVELIHWKLILHQ